MIYEVYLNDNLLYYPNDDSYSIINSKLETALNEAGTFECDIPQKNMRYTDFDNGAQLRSGIITVLKDGEEIFCGEVREVTQNFDFTKHIYAVGELAYLFDSIQPQAKYQGTVSDMFSALLANHNSQVEARKQFSVGNVLVTDPNGYIYHFTNREDTLTDLREKLCNTLDGYLKIRKVSGVKYLDFVPLSSYGTYCKQEIQFGENMLNYSANYTANDIATCVIPLGVRLEEDQRTADAIDGLDEYLTIKGTTTDSYHANTNDDYVYIQSAVNTFGWVRVVQHWDDVTIAENLKTKAEQWLTDAQYSKLILEVSAVDLALMNSDIDSFEVGDTVHAWSEPYNMDTTFPVQKKTIYLNDLSKNSIVLSNTKPNKSYTSQQSDAVNELKSEIPQTYTILEESQNRALDLLLDQTQGGYIVYEFHYDSVTGKADYIEAINICNATTIDLSTSRWRWSFNGLGFLERNSTSDPWPTSAIPIALTNDGKIVAEQIGAGTISGCEMFWGDNATYTGRLYYDNLASLPTLYVESNAGLMLKGSDNAYISSNNLTSVGGKYTSVSGTRSTSLGNSNTPKSLYGNSLDINGVTGASGSISWVDTTQRKAFGLGVTKGIVTYINAVDY